MYLIQATVKESSINGKGVFSLQNIKAGEIVWKFDLTHDKTLTQDEFDALLEDEKRILRPVAYLSKTTERWVYPPENDIARYTNHSKSNNLSVKFDLLVSEEPFFIANRDIEAGEELTNNYNEFDDFLKNSASAWLK